MTALKQFFLVACAILATACGSTTNSGNPVPGGAPGNPCVAANTPVGCYTEPGTTTSSIVNCPTDVSPATWTAGTACGAGTHCVVTSKMEASCAANPVVVVNDTVSGSKDTGDNSSACVDAVCAKETAACKGNATCTNAFVCLGKCNSDQACQDACGAPLKADPIGAKIFQDYFQCAMNAAFSCQPKADGTGSDSKSDTLP